MVKQMQLMLGGVLVLLILTGCGLKGPLYQTPEQPPTSPPASVEQQHAEHNAAQE